MYDTILFSRFMIQTPLLPEKEQMKNLHHKLDQENLKSRNIDDCHMRIFISGTAQVSRTIKLSVEHMIDPPASVLIVAEEEGLIIMRLHVLELVLNFRGCGTF
jgi:hypothetical protein